jgi:hypothetical protein
MRSTGILIASPILLAWSHPALAAAERHFHVAAGSQVAYHVGVVTLGVREETIDGINPRVSGDFALVGGKHLAGRITADIAGFASGIRGRDRNVAHLLGAPALPEVAFELERLDGYQPGRPSGEAIVTGLLSANGHQVPAHFPIRYHNRPGGLQVDGEQVVSFSAFGIAPPILGFVLKRAPDAFTLRVHLIANESPAATSGSAKQAEG